MTEMGMNDLAQRPLFICGLPRSGTTLLQGLLDGHPQLVVDAAESQFFRQFVPQSQGLTKAQKFDLAESILLRIFRPETQYNQLYLDHISYEQIRSSFIAFLEESEKRLPDYLAAAVLAFGQVSGQLQEHSIYWVEKSPYNENYVDYIFNWWPQAHCVHMIRDPRDHYAAFKQRAIHNQRDIPAIEAFAWEWQCSLRQGVRRTAIYGPNRYHIIRYEDLAQDPAKQMQTLIHLLNISDYKGLYNPTKTGGLHSWKGNSSYHTHFSGISQSSLDRWQAELTLEEVRLLEAFIGPTMHHYHYQPATKSATTWQLATLPGRGRNLLRTIKFAVKNTWHYRHV
jgi:hypothetical protein